MDKTLYISDLDGTLLNRSAALSDYALSALNAMQADGLNFSVATARTAVSAFSILAGIRFTAPVVLMNGVLIYDHPRGRYAQIHALPAETAAAVVSALKRLGVTGIMYRFVDGEQLTYYESLESGALRAFVEERQIRYGKIFTRTDSFADVPADGVVFFALLDTESNIRRIHGALSDLRGVTISVYRDVYSADQWFLEIQSDRASKRSGVEYLRKTCGYTRVVCFGDNLNDLPMFEASDIRVAVENARAEVRAAADFVCGANDTDGVVKWIEKHWKSG